MSGLGLAPTYRWTVLNACGQTLAANAAKVHQRRSKLNSQNVLTYESAVDSVTINTGTLATATYASLATPESNTTDLYLGGDFLFEVTAPASANGNVSLYYDLSPDGGTSWPTNGLGALVAVLNFITSGQKFTSFEL